MHSVPSVYLLAVCLKNVCVSAFSLLPVADESASSPPTSTGTLPPLFRLLLYRDSHICGPVSVVRSLHEFGIC